MAQSELVHWVAAETAMSTLDSYQPALGVRSPVANVVDMAYTMVAKVPKAFLPGVDPVAARTDGSAHVRRSLASPGPEPVGRRRRALRRCSLHDERALSNLLPD